MKARFPSGALIVTPSISSLLKVDKSQRRRGFQGPREVRRSGSYLRCSPVASTMRQTGSSVRSKIAAAAHSGLAPSCGIGPTQESPGRHRASRGGVNARGPMGGRFLRLWSARCAWP